MKNFYATFLVFSLPLFAFAQQFTVTGLVQDSASAEPAIGAFVKLVSLKDTAKIYTAVTNNSGRFYITNATGRGFKLEIRAIGYKQFSKQIRVETSVLDLGTLSLKPSTELLNEVQVTETMQRSTQKGDTTQFNADAFKTNPDANAEDLIKKLPGVSVENGSVTAQGEKVQVVLVDGKPFFGNDPNAALKNIPAEAIEKIEVFDRKSDQAKFTGFDDGQEQKTINIITRPKYKNGTFGRAFAGYGTDDHYQAGGNLNHFENDQRISVVGLTNNINQQNFGNEDLLGVAGTSATNNQPRFMRGPTVDSDPNDFVVGSQNGINTTHSFGINYTDEFGAKFKMNASYFFNKTLNNTEQLINQNFYTTDTTSQIYTSSALGSGTNNNHRFNVRMEYKLNDKNTFIFTPNASIQTNASSSQNDASTQESFGALLNNSLNRYTTNLNGYNLAGDFLWQHNFEKKGRTISFNLRGNNTANTGTTELLAVTDYYGTNPTTDSIAQEGLPNTDRTNLRSNTRYTEPLGEKSQLMFSHNFEADFNNSNKETYNFDPDSGERTSLDSNVSNVFSSVYQEHQFGLGYRYNSKKINAGVGIDYQTSTLTSDLQFPRTGEIYREFKNYLPFLMMRYQISKQKNLRIYMRSSTDEPSVTQLQDVVNNSNPLQLYIGNPNLKQAYGTRLGFRYSSTNEEKATNFSANGMVRKTNNYITTASLIADKDTLIGNDVVLNQGSQLRYPVNLNGYWMANGTVTWGLPMGKLRSNLNLSTSANYARTPGLINAQNNLAQTLGLAQSIGVTSNISEKIDFNVSFRADVNLVYNSLQPELNNNYYIQTSTAGLSWIFWDGWVIRTSVNHTWYAGLTESFNQNFMLWNASLGKKLFKNKQGELSISVFDILNQNQSIVRNVTESYVQDVQTLVLRQYFMLTFTYNLKAFKDE